MQYLFFIIILLFTGCADDNFKKYSNLKDFRVLAIKADFPEVNDDNSAVSMTVLVSDISQEGRVVDLVVEACLDPGVSSGEEISCAGAEKYQLVTTMSINMATEFSGSVFTGVVSPIVVNIPGNILSDRNELERFNGINYLVLFKFSHNGNKLLDSFKRIKVSTRLAKNSNPEIGDIGDIEFSQGERSLLVGVQSEPESFPFIDLTGASQIGKEIFYLSWFSSVGDIENPQVLKGENTKIVFNKDLPSEAVVLVVLRDGRGGVDFKMKKLP